MVVEQTNRGSGPNDLFSRPAHGTSFHPTGRSRIAWATLVVAQMLFLAAETRRDEISIYINSPGGW